MLKIGLTGGICCGKSTVTKFFSQLGVPIIDADKISHELTTPGKFCYQKIIEHFNLRSLLSPKSKKLIRNHLREIIFKNPLERLWLEDLLHPLIKRRMEEEFNALNCLPYSILAIPLLLETRHPIKVDRILVVDCPPTSQMERLIRRDQCSKNQAKKIIASQVNHSIRIKMADDIIYNHDSPSELKKATKILHNYYLSLT